MAEYTVVDSAAGFRAAIDQVAAGTGPVAVDVERASGFRYSQRAYLVQLYRRESGVLLLDPPAIGETFAPLREVIADQEWVFHAASQDIPSLRELEMLPATLFDTELASRLLGRERVGLGAVVEQTLGVSLAKAHSASDWSTRPLPQAWLEYAAHDVEYLLDVRDILAADLAAAGKTEIAAQEFHAVLTKEPKVVREDPWRRLSGLHTVRGPRGLAMARALWLAREALAEQQDVSPGRLVPDRALVAAVIADPRSKQELAALKEFTGRASRSELDRWWAAIEAGRSDENPPPDRVRSADPLPPVRAWADRAPDADARLKAAKVAVDAVAQELSMPVENLLTPELLRRVAWAPPTPLTAELVGAALAAGGARPWQVAHTAQVIVDAFVESAQAIVSAPEAPS